MFLIFEVDFSIAVLGFVSLLVVIVFSWVLSFILFSFLLFNNLKIK